MIDLKPFCADECIYKYRLLDPSSYDQYTVATDRHIIVRVPRRADVPEVAEYPDVKGLFAAARADYDLADVPIVDKPDYTPVKCPLCNGDKREVKYCFKCDDGYLIPKKITVQIGDQHYDTKYINLINQFPKASISYG